MVLVRHVRMLQQWFAYNIVLAALQRRSRSAGDPTNGRVHVCRGMVRLPCLLATTTWFATTCGVTEDGLVHEHVRDAPDLRARESLEDLDLREARAPALPDGRKGLQPSVIGLSVDRTCIVLNRGASGNSDY